MSRVLVGTDGVPLGPVSSGNLEVLGVAGTEDVEAVAVIGGDDDQGLVEFSNLLQVLNGLSDGIVELEQLAQRTFVVEHVEHLVDGGGLGHHEEALVLGVTSLEDVDGLQGHLSETGLVQGRASGVDKRRNSSVDQVVGVDVAVEPPAQRITSAIGKKGEGSRDLLGHVALAEDPQSALARIGGLEGGVVVDDLIALSSEGIVVVGTVGRSRSRFELFGTTAEEHI